MEQKMFHFQTGGEEHRRLCAGSSPACEPGFTPVLILSLMVACSSLDMVYIQIVMEEDQKRRSSWLTPAIPQLLHLLLGFSTALPDWEGT